MHQFYRHLAPIKAMKLIKSMCHDGLLRISCDDKVGFVILKKIFKQWNIKKNGKLANLTTISINGNRNIHIGKLEHTQLSRHSQPNTKKLSFRNSWITGAVDCKREVCIKFNDECAAVFSLTKEKKDNDRYWIIYGAQIDENNQYRHLIVINQRYINRVKLTVYITTNKKKIDIKCKKPDRNETFTIKLQQTSKNIAIKKEEIKIQELKDIPILGKYQIYQNNNNKIQKKNDMMNVDIMNVNNYFNRYGGNINKEKLIKPNIMPRFNLYEHSQTPFHVNKNKENTTTPNIIPTINTYACPQSIFQMQSPLIQQSFCDKENKGIQIVPSILPPIGINGYVNTPFEMQTQSTIHSFSGYKKKENSIAPNVMPTFDTYKCTHSSSFNSSQFRNKPY